MKMLHRLTYRSNRAIALSLLTAIVGFAVVITVLIVFEPRSPVSTPTASPSPTPTSTSAPGTPYVKPGTQGYRGAVSALTVYSEANGKVPAGSACSWASQGILSCPDDNLTLDHSYIQGSLNWRGCRTLSISNSVIEWQPADRNWFSVDASCESPLTGALITVTRSTFKTAGAAPYTGMSDVGAINEYANLIPEHISNSLFRDFPQGLDPAVYSVIKDNEIYVSDGLKCWQDAAKGIIGTCHADGLYNQGSPNTIYKGNYIDAGANSTTSALFYQGDSPIIGNRVIGNYIAGGAYTLYNQNATGLDVENNTFGGYRYGNCSLRSGASWGKWTGNVKPDGSAVVPNGDGCN